YSYSYSHSYAYRDSYCYGYAYPKPKTCRDTPSPSDAAATPDAVKQTRAPKKLEKLYVSSNHSRHTQFPTPLRIVFSKLHVEKSVELLLFWGEQPPFMPIGCGGRSFLSHPELSSFDFPRKTPPQKIP